MVKYRILYSLDKNKILVQRSSDLKTAIMNKSMLKDDGSSSDLLIPASRAKAIKLNWLYDWTKQTTNKEAK